MAIVNFAHARQAIDMADADLVAFGRNPSPFPSGFWTWFTPVGHKLELFGEGIAFDATGRATAGTIHTIEIDMGNNNPFVPDVTITGIDADAASLDDGVAGFWSMLSGNDTIIGPDKDRAGLGASRLFGDASLAADGGVGGHDTIDAGDANLHLSGDALFVLGGNAPAPVLYGGGRDFIFGFNTGERQRIAGDAIAVSDHAKLTGGADVIRARSFNEFSSVAGDVEQVDGDAGAIAEVAGGHDDIFAIDGFDGEIHGDVGVQLDHTIVRGGHDRIVVDPTSQRDVRISGDVGDLSATDQGTIGGNDTIRAGRGDGRNLLAGDVLDADDGAVVTGGDDTIHGGMFRDEIWGEVARGDAILTGGDDMLFGHGGDDLIRGQSGDDLLDGGEGDDNLAGGAGDDVYVTDAFGDVVIELAGEGIDTIRTTQNNVGLVGNVENLTFVGTGNFRAGGNILSNRITGGAGDDIFLADGSGADVFSGLSGFDILDFRGLGAAIINLGTNVHGGSASGDSFSGIESILGSAIGADTMTGGAAAVTFSGLGGADTLRGGSGADVLHGGEGADSLDGGAGGDIFLGGDEGRDTIDGGAGNDTADGGEDNDVVRGGDGHDTLRGGDGGDVISGGAGRDTLAGGFGNDRFEFLSLAERGDRLADFANLSGDNDALRFAGDAFGGLPTGTLAAARFVASTEGVATTPDQRFVYETDTGILRFDANGSLDGGVTVIATITGAPALTSGDFVII